MKNIYCFSITVAVLATLLLPASAYSQWSTDPTINNPICTATGDQKYPAMISDGSGGAIIAWQDPRNGGDTLNHIYAQRINASGTVQWTADGVAISTAVGNQLNPMLVSDGSGGAIITWQDQRSGTYDIYARRINSSGAVQWTVQGVAICTATGDQENPMIVSDGSGGAIITWYDYRSGSNFDIYAQRINSSGTVQWTANGVAICTATGNQFNQTILSDGSGGAVITWMDQRSGSNYNIYAQRINASGTVQWAANGVAICVGTGYKWFPRIVSDGSGGAIITWYDSRSGSSYDIYAQRINLSGTVQWAVNGVAICTATSQQIDAVIVSDGSGGAIITWEDSRSGSTYDIYAQRISASGTVQWTANGVAIRTATGDVDNLGIVSDGSGGRLLLGRIRAMDPTPSVISTRSASTQRAQSSGLPTVLRYARQQVTKLYPRSSVTA